MSALKICTYSRTTWLPDVRMIEQLGSFDTPVEQRETKHCDSTTSRKLRRKKDDTILSAAINACSDDMRAGIQIAEFGAEETGSVLRVKQHGAEDKIWLVPSGSCFLIADSGKTIDRI